MAGKSVKKAVGVLKRASTILKGIKKEYQKELQKNVRSNMAITTSAKKASKTYKEKFGATPTTRWHNALKQASSGTKTTKKTTTKVAKPKKVAAKKVVKAAPKIAPKPILTKKTATKTAIKPILPKVAKPKKIAVKKVVKVAPKTTPKPKISTAPIVAAASKITAPKATKTAKSNAKFDIEKYVSTDKYRPVMNCVYYDNADKVAVATDIYVLVYSKELYNPKYAGKMIAARDIWKGKGMKNERIEYAKGAIVEGKYPNWKALITKNNKLAVKINTQKLYDFVVDCEKTIKEEIKKINDKIDQRLKNGETKYMVGKHKNAKSYLEESGIVFLYNGKYLAMVSLLKLKKFVAAMLFLGTDTLYFDAEDTKHRAIMTYNSNGGALIMPKVFDDEYIDAYGGKNIDNTDISKYFKYRI